MLILGISGGVAFPYEENLYDMRFALLHDSSAVLVRDGQVVAAIEEERLTRIKHTDTAPINAMKFCLDSCGATIDDVDKIAVYIKEDTLNSLLETNFVEHANQSAFLNAREYIHRIVSKAFGKDIDDEKICFVPHHTAHAESAYYMSGFDSSLVLSIDGAGDDLSLVVQSRKGNSVSILCQNPLSKSLGGLYLEVIKYLGYNSFDEYKVMGLAPYGNPKKYRRLFKKLYSLKPDGQYEIYLQYLNPILFNLALPRRKGEPFTQIHKDIAASLQEGLEIIVMHILEYYQKTTGHKKLCMAGGVAHNCALNGKILYSGLFEDIFVQPAAHDAGCALGAALWLSQKEKKVILKERQEHVYWGKNIGTNDSIEKKLKCWEGFIEYKKLDNVVKYVAELLANGSVIGWVQGNSEFGPRALGNRSILADPRPSENKNIINMMVKKREAYRPFAPSILEEYVTEYYEVPTKYQKFPFMNFVLKTKQEKQSLLGAITHVDGTARVQTVSKNINKKYWELIEEFRKITGIPILLNTSFNNNAEPIVDSLDDSIVCFLTTKLHYIVIGDYFISRKVITTNSYLDMTIALPVHVQLQQYKKFISFDKMDTTYEIMCHHPRESKIKISKEVYKLLLEVNKKVTVKALVKELGYENSIKCEQIINELISLWEARMILLKPEE